MPENKKIEMSEEEKKLEAQRLVSLSQAVVKARWFFVLIYSIFGMGSTYLKRFFIQWTAFDTASASVDFSVRNEVLQIGVVFFILYNLFFYFFFKRKNLKFNQAKLVNYFQIIFDTVFAIAMFYATGTIEGQGVVLLFFPVVIAAILFNPLVVTIVSLVVISCSGAIVYHEYTGVLPHVPLYDQAIASKIFTQGYAVTYAFISVAAAIASIAVYFGLSSRILRFTEANLKKRSVDLLNERNKIEAVVTNLIDGLILLDDNQKIALVNPEAASILDLNVHQCLGQRINEIKASKNLDALYQALGKKIEWTGQKYDFSIGNPLARYFQVLTNPVVTINGQKIGLMIILHDITREKEVEHLKTEFVSIAAHQLRTPLAAIKWTLKMALDGDAGQLTQDQASLLEGGYQSNERMIELINDLLNVARIEEGRFLYEMSTFALEDSVQKIINSLNPLALKKEIKIDVSLSQEHLPEVEGDKEKIELIIQNLIENAIKYTPEKGKVTISVKADTMNVEMLVADSGIGIPTQQQERIFSKFFRADNAQRAGVEGTGMGLFICKSIIEKHGGRIWFESEENKGTSFWFTLPLKNIVNK